MPKSIRKQTVDPNLQCGYDLKLSVKNSLGTETLKLIFFTIIVTLLSCKNEHTKTSQLSESSNGKQQAKSVQQEGQRTLRVKMFGTGAGSVESIQNGMIHCGPESGCSALVDIKRGVSLIATPGAYSKFAGWQGNACSDSNSETCVIKTWSNAFEDTEVSAVFLRDYSREAEQKFDACIAYSKQCSSAYGSTPCCGNFRCSSEGLCIIPVE